jgi:hypothetical protein
MRRTISASARHITNAADDIAPLEMSGMSLQELQFAATKGTHKGTWLTHAERDTAIAEFERRDPAAHAAWRSAVEKNMAALHRAL